MRDLRLTKMFRIPALNIIDCDLMEANHEAGQRGASDDTSEGYKTHEEKCMAYSLAHVPGTNIEHQIESSRRKCNRLASGYSAMQKIVGAIITIRDDCGDEREYHDRKNYRPHRSLLRGCEPSLTSCHS
jgi:hypothetical protein